MAIRIPQRPVNNEDNSAFGKVAGPLGLAGLVATLAAPFTAGGSLAALSGAAATGATAGTLGAAGGAVGAANAIHSANKQTEMQNTPQPVQPQGVKPVETAMGRKFNQLSEDPASKLLEAGRALNNLPPEAQQEYKPILSNAYAKAKIGRF